MSPPIQSTDVTVDRLLAFLIDGFIFGVESAIVYGIFFFISLNVAGLMGAATGEGWVALSMSVGGILVRLTLGLLKWTAIFGVIAGYFVYFQRDDGQTIGKSVMDVTVVSSDSGPATNTQLIKRSAVLIAPFPLIYLLAIVGILTAPMNLLIDPIAVALLFVWVVVEGVVIVVRGGVRFGDSIANTAVVEA